MHGTVVSLLVGGVVGVFARWLIALAVFETFGGWLPWGTLAVNLTGCFLIGLFDALIRSRGFGGTHARLLLITGFCGGYTTFSSLILELDALLRVAPWRGGAYLALSAVAGLALFRAGLALGGG